MEAPRRKNIRLEGFDYTSEGSYFVTIVTKDRNPLFGEIDGEMKLNDYGRIVDFTWNDLGNHNPDIGLDEFVIMPNHIHGIIHLFDPVGAGSKPAHLIGAGFPRTQKTRLGATNAEPAPTKNVALSEIVRQFKTFSAKRINAMRRTTGVPVWQRNYYDHIIGYDREYENIAKYISDNPANWMTDEERDQPDW